MLETPVAPAIPEDEAPALGDPPFQGLQYFDEADADRFFGREHLTARLVERLRQEPLLAVVGASGSGKSSVVRAGLLPALRQSEDAYHARIPTATLNKVLREAQAAHPPPVERGHRPRILYATQGAAEPPTFTLFTTRSPPPTYLRYLERKLRESFDLGPPPIKLRVRRRND